MSFTIDFLYELGRLLFYGFPLFMVLILAISGLGIWIGKKEDWSISDSLYFGFITATTVGYGDFHPRQKSCKFVAIVIALLGLMLTGIIISVSFEALTLVVDKRDDLFGPR